MDASLSKLERTVFIVFVSYLTNFFFFSKVAPEAKIRKQSELRETFKTLSGQWKELDKIYQKEASKKKVRKTIETTATAFQFLIV
jgi:hypothetical protein